MSCLEVCRPQVWTARRVTRTGHRPLDPSIVNRPLLVSECPSAPSDGWDASKTQERHDTTCGLLPACPPARLTRSHPFTPSDSFRARRNTCGGALPSSSFRGCVFRGCVGFLLVLLHGSSLLLLLLSSLLSQRRLAGPGPIPTHPSEVQQLSPER
ncbi:hypothetical protein C8R46DRAFT_517070 [Mycena filopes]|nr:hypothetical protein C8R46DRAFT_517070 [Mycena filopes]